MSMFKCLFWAVVFSLSFWIAWMFADSTPPYMYDAEKSYMDPDPAPQGSMITANWALVRVNRVCPATVQRMFRNADGRVVSTLDTTEASRAVRVGDDALPRSFRLPSSLPPEVRYSALVCFQCNLVQKLWPLCVTTPEIKFSMKEKS